MGPTKKKFEAMKEYFRSRYVINIPIERFAQRHTTSSSEAPKLFPRVLLRGAIKEGTSSFNKAHTKYEPPNGLLCRILTITRTHSRDYRHGGQMPHTPSTSSSATTIPLQVFHSFKTAAFLLNINCRHIPKIQKDTTPTREVGKHVKKYFVHRLGFETDILVRLAGHPNFTTAPKLCTLKVAEGHSFHILLPFIASLSAYIFNRQTTIEALGYCLSRQFLAFDIVPVSFRLSAGRLNLSDFAGSAEFDARAGDACASAEAAEKSTRQPASVN
ncbi:hypothetical protein EVAR_30633_1 [Eumeta japonica]|uniref:Uncharacterized protein n=1 Tax=Eumeta variegata TaxID=151549 RepID=A0A4C1VTQ3_EUMVA|nr:hypothetical protein EVAR_30633_1 [Eumeta japonica]